MIKHERDATNHEPTLDKMLLDPIFLLKWINSNTLWIIFESIHDVWASHLEAVMFWLAGTTKSEGIYLPIDQENRTINEPRTRARGYKEKHKLDSKLISDSAFRTHLSFCKNREIINLSDLKLKTQTSNSGSWRCYVGGGKRNENRDSIKCGKRKGGKLDGPMQCY